MKPSAEDQKAADTMTGAATDLRSLELPPGVDGPLSVSESIGCIDPGSKDEGLILAGARLNKEDAAIIDEIAERLRQRGWVPDAPRTRSSDGLADQIVLTRQVDGQRVRLLVWAGREDLGSVGTLAPALEMRATIDHRFC